jgi:hypothetical protein
MHYLHQILVSAESEETATEAAVSVISEYGDGKVWDWHEEDAGRWKDRYPAPVKAGAKKFKTLIDEARASQQEEARRLAWHIAQGPRPVSPESPRIEWGSPDFKAKFMEGIQAYGDWLYGLIEKLPETRDYNWGLVGYALNGITQLAEGEYRSGSFFYDGISGGGGVPSDKELDDYRKDAEKNGEDLWLVPIDMHN